VDHGPRFEPVRRRPDLRLRQPEPRQGSASRTGLGGDPTSGRFPPTRRSCPAARRRCRPARTSSSTAARCSWRARPTHRSATATRTPRRRSRCRAGTGPVAHVGGVPVLGRAVLLMTQMLGHLLVQRRIQHALRELLEQPVRPGQGQTLLPGHPDQLLGCRLLRRGLRLLLRHNIQCRHHGTFLADLVSGLGRKHRCWDSPRPARAVATRSVDDDPARHPRRRCRWTLHKADHDPRRSGRERLGRCADLRRETQVSAAFLTCGGLGPLGRCG